MRDRFFAILKCALRPSKYVLIHRYRPHADLKVYENGEKEFHLARTRLIQQSARAVAHGRIPPPFNLVQLFSGFVVDAIIEVIWWCVKANR